MAAPVTIITGRNVSPQENYAAKELAEHFKLAVGETFPIIKEGNKVSGKVIYVGNTKFALSKGVDFKRFGKEEWLIKSFGNALVIGGGAPRGTVYAALEFLERNLGVMWLDEWSTYVPKCQAINWNKNLNVKGRPSFNIRGVFSYFPPGKSYQSRRFVARNRQNHFHDARKIGSGARELGVDRMYGSPRSCHTFYNYTKDWGKNKEKCFSYSRQHKKWLRATSAHGPGQVCFTNPETRRLFTEKLLDYIKSDRKNSLPNRYPIVYCLMANDNNQKCECKKCLAAAKKYKAYSGLMIEFINDIANRIKKYYPDVIIQTAAYMYTAAPPVGIKPADNVMVQIAQLGGEYSGASRDTCRPLSCPNNKLQQQQIVQWGKIANLGIWDYWVLFAGRGKYPAVNVKSIAENLRFYHKNGVSLVFAECEWEHYTSFHALRLWVGYRFLNNLNLNVDQEIKRFIKAYYGKAAPYMQEYYDYLQKRNNEVKGSLSDLPLNRRSDLDDAFFRTTERLLSAAEKAESGNKLILHRIGRERISVDMARLDKRQLLSKNLQPDQKTVIKRLRNNFEWVCKTYNRADKLKNNIQEMNNFCAGLLANVPALSGFEKRDVIADYAWPKLVANRLRATVIDEPDAAGGRAIAMTGKEGRDPAKNAKNRGIKFGLYNFSERRHLGRVAIPKESLIQDEKYHFYSLGRVHLSEKCFFWMHWTWLCQLNISELYDPSGCNNDVEIYVSIKLQGPNYVKGSTKPNLYAIDRVVVCRADTP